jgi:hypothetical protein
MVLKDSVSALKDIMHLMCRDLDKTIRGNRAAAQRVRTASVKFAKLAKDFRKESVSMGGKLKKIKKSLKKKR